MKKILLFIVAFALLSFAKKNALTENYSLISASNESYYMGKYEVSNQEYKEFLNSLDSNSNNYKLAKVEHQKWITLVEMDETATSLYFTEKEYQNFPVVNVSYEGAQLYCAYLSNKLSTEMGKKVVAKLPTKNQWIYAASGGNTEMKYGWGKEELTDKRGYAYANYDLLGEGNQNLTAPVNAYLGNEFSLYNCSGNVSEMLNEKGFAIGGNFTTSLSNIELKKSITAFNEANPATGFRVVLQIIE
jgi:formylglycine-generating enzyme required for sulfatase activity